MNKIEKKVKSEIKRLKKERNILLNVNNDISSAIIKGAILELKVIQNYIIKIKKQCKD